MKNHHAIHLAILAAMLAGFAAFGASCGGGGNIGKGGHATTSTTSTSTGTGGTSGTGGGLTLNPDGGPNGGGDGGTKCEPPDVLIVLDRTLTMHFTPDGVNPTDAPAYASSKWSQAISAIEAMVAPPLDKSIRFGLELWPKGGDGCITLAERVTDSVQATNPACENGEIPVPPGPDNGKKIQDLLDPETTKLCSTTPTGNALQTAFDYLKLNGSAGRAQYLVLVTDGADWDQTCAEPNPLPIVQEIAKAGIKTFVVGFSTAAASIPTGVGVSFLNNLACAGMTAPAFPAGCKLDADGGGGYTAVNADTGPKLFLSAGDGGALAATLHGIGASLCCDCQPSCDPPEMMITLDRTLTMHRTPSGATPTDPPDYASSKWVQAISAIEKMVAPPRDNGVRFGLTLWPKGGDGCITLAERVTDSKQATNPACEEGQVVVPPDVGKGTAIASLLDPATTLLCSTTPTGKGLLTAADHLIAHSTPGRQKFITLVTDGADWDQTCALPDPLPIVQDLAAAGIKTYVVGFSAEAATMPGSVGATFLNHMACAGMTAKGFPGTCMIEGGGYKSNNPMGPPVYLAADDTTGLDAALDSITVSVCCGCIQ